MSKESGYLISAGLYGRQLSSIPFQPLNLGGTALNPVAIDYRAPFGISTAFSVVIFAEHKLKINAGCLFDAIGNTIQRDSLRINAVMFKGALE
jgi:hypothetical protein